MSAIAEVRAKAVIARQELEPQPWIMPPPGVTINDSSINKTLLDYIWRNTQQGWLLLLSVATMLLGLLSVGIALTVWKGIGMWGNNIPVGWGWGITNFVWWIGIGHAGTLISAILLLFQQKWRTSINRFAEAMTLFAVACAGLFPILHTGRPWLAIYWLFPYPSTMWIWPNFKSPLTWDVFAVSTYAITSLLFWFIGLIPDVAALRDASVGKLKRRIYGFVALGWTGSARAWNHYKIGYLLLAGIATPLVLSVHSIVSFDFAVSLIPGWHTTIFPPYFVAGAVYSGFGMVCTLMIPARKVLKIEHVITARHIELMTKIMLLTGLIVTYGYVMEHFSAFFSGDKYEYYVFLNRRAGPLKLYFFTMMFCNCVVPNFWWFKVCRTNLYIVWGLSILVNIGMWCERFVIIVMSLHRDFLPSSWAMFHATWVDVSLYLGTIGLFSTLMLLFVRFLPAVAVSEIKEMHLEIEHANHAVHEAEHRALAAAGAGAVPAHAHAAPISGQEN
jgi:Ni/Fe-hydrogenase subunit HybB-like protein